MTVRLDGVSFTYPGTAEPALRDLSLTFESGQVTWLFGRLGAGASTLLLVSGGFAPALTGGTRQGSVRIDGADPGIIQTLSRRLRSPKHSGPRLRPWPPPPPRRRPRLPQPRVRAAAPA